MIKITRGWPPARRKAQAERIKKTKPWLKSTGPRTALGKAKIKYNAWKHGCQCHEMLRVRAVLRRQRDYLTRVKERYTSRLCSTAALMKLVNNGCGSNGLDLSSG